MPRLPDLNDLGQRPVPASRRQTASNPRAGAVGEAVAGLGEQVAGIGQRMIEREDRAAYATAKAAVLQADVAARQELENDPDYENWGTKYAARMATAREAAGRLIRSNSDRQLFGADVDLDVERGNAALATAATARRRDAKLADGVDALETLSDVAQSAIDEPTREATITNAHDLLRGLREQGVISAADEGRLRRDWTQNYVVQRVETLRAGGDLEGALATFEANRGRLNSDTEIRLGQQISDAMENRETLVLAEDFVHGGGATTPAAGAPSDADPTPMSAPGWTSVATNVADEFNLDPVEVAAVMSYETAGTFSPSVMGGTGGRYMGLIQFGPEERQKYGITANSTPDQWTAAITGFLKDRGFKRGMGVLDLYSTINAGRPGRYDASDGNDTVRGHVSRLMSEHRENAEHWLESGGAVVNEAPQRHDLDTIYNAINERAAAEGWTPERTERIKAQAATLVERDEALLNREEADAYEQVLGRIEALGDGFTNVSQLGDAYYRMSPDRKITVQGIAAQNAKPAATPANGDVIRSLHTMAIEAPGQFAQLDLRPYRAFMTPGEFDEVSTSQARAKEETGQWSPRTSIQSAITWGQNFGGVEVKDGEDKYRVYRYMETRAQQFRREASGRDPAESDYQRWFREATAETHVTRSVLGIDILAPDHSARAYDTLSPNYRSMIVREYRRLYRKDPNEQQIQQWFDRMGEALN